MEMSCLDDPMIIHKTFNQLGNDVPVQRVSSSYSETLQRRNMLLGSRPPGCVDKCMNCRPCKATLVIPSHDQRKGYRESSHREDDSYYLLSWKCICGDKLFHP
ncbi:unnamed protein product [Ilex paraguariensis]|uniref:Epidermal patterning factor-like protein n=1 Tax=Ilex paraguariensis TaxID=185542 RepID=A0ABC8T624_9AQUA